jgi:SAM-dependent methyltransferase
MITFTICSRNFLAYAHTLLESLQSFHEDVLFYVGLCDERGDLDLEALPFRTIMIDELGVPNWEAMRARYNITELNTALKPFVFSYIFDLHPGQPVLYLDPDILAVGPFDELIDLAAEGANCVLVPHVNAPSEFAEMNDQEFLRYGAYNLGFCMLRDTAEVRRVVSWWGRRLETHCVIDLQSGLFVDQKWADLFPAYIEGTRILRHPGYDVAYWNLSQRRVRHEPDGTWTVNGEGLRFFHFSGNQIEDPEVFSRHSQQFTMANIGDLALLLKNYRRDIERHGHGWYKGMPYAFNWNGGAAQNLHTPASLDACRRATSDAHPYLPLLRASGPEQFRRARLAAGEVWHRRLQVEADAIPPGRRDFSVDGYCAACERRSSFEVSFAIPPRRSPEGRTVPDWREQLRCAQCGLDSRGRAAILVLRQEVGLAADAALYIAGRADRTRDWLKQHYKFAASSEYADPEERCGGIVDATRHEKVRPLSFAEEKFDCIVSFDIPQGVQSELSVFREFLRCLRPGGVLVLAARFFGEGHEHEASREPGGDGDVRRLTGEHRYGDSGEREDGFVHRRHVGWKILDELRDMGFVEPEMLNYWSRTLVHFGDRQFIVVARKPLASDCTGVAWREDGKRSDFATSAPGDGFVGAILEGGGCQVIDGQ